MEAGEARSESLTRCASCRHIAPMDARWQFWIDRGGTFTDVVGRAPDGRLVPVKLLSENSELYEDAAVEGMRRLLDLPRGARVPEGLVAQVKIGTTVATNALLERKGARTLLVTTKGLKDQLRIGYQNRPKLFVRRIDLPALLYEAVVEADERVTYEGQVLRPLDEAGAREALSEAYGRGLRACAVVLMHGYRWPDHERRVGAIAREIGFEQVSLSHEASPLIRFVSRGDTTVADAYLSPVLRDYVDRVSARVEPRLLFMMSSGGVTEAARFLGKDAVLSGPAGGVVGAVRTAMAAGFERVIGFDMGGTSTDVMHCAQAFSGAYERTEETQVAGVRIRAPMMLIHTVAAGGGSILHDDGVRFRVGPDSAGANPGPACYRRGGPLTVTDANVMLGKLRPDRFPAVFGPDGDQPIDAAIVRARFAELAARHGRAPEEIAEGFVRIAVENMANAIKKISVQRGYDVTKYLLNCFGGAGGQHACRVADALGMETILIHPLSGLLSAYGIGMASLRAIRQRAIERPLDEDCAAAMREAADVLAREATGAIEAQGAPADLVSWRPRAHLRYDGTDTVLDVPLGPVETMRADFADAHRRRFGFGLEGRTLVVDWVSVEAAGGGVEPSDPELAVHGGQPAPPDETITFFADGAPRDAALYIRARLKPGDRIDGPALIVEPNQTVVVEPGWRAELTAKDHLILTRALPRPTLRAAGTAADPVTLEIFNSLFMSIAEQMGLTLEKTASSVNIKERLDFSCAIYDGDGALIANAPHMPVHLGSMGDSVAAVRAKHPSMRSGDVFALNAPYAGGTHLPDVTVVAPVFDEAGERVLFFTAARGHHADIGGITPGSMPPFSTDVREEGALFDGQRIVAGGVFDEAGVRAMLGSGSHPARNPDQNVADLKAQIAACAKGAEELRAAVALWGLDVVRAYMGHVQDNAEEAVRRAIGALKDGAFEMAMDGGATIKVAIRVDARARTAEIDFGGTSPQLPSNFNAPASVTKAAVLYAFRCLVDDDIPLNAGCLRPLTIRIPEGSMLSPRFPAAVVAGNVETSQAVTDAIFGAMGVMAAAQGTMNNLTFGDATRQYYETICGGAGAGPDFDGASAVHTHMTNSRLTDPEVLESRYPVLLRRFAVREGSGGPGRRRGGDGVVREIEFRAPMDCGILSTRRETAPFGLAGGGHAAKGVNAVLRADGSVETLGGCGVAKMEPGDAIRIDTPGGGGYGEA